MVYHTWKLTLQFHIWKNVALALGLKGLSKHKVLAVL